MDIFEFLSFTRNTNEIYTESKCSDDLKFVFEIYSTLIKATNIVDFYFPQLVITVGSTNDNHTQMINLNDVDYIVLELNHISYISELFELVCFEKINNNLKISLFQDLCIRSFKATLFKNKVIDNDSTFDFEYVWEDNYTNLEKELFKNSIVKNLSNYMGFSQVFKIIVTFVIAHELTHSLINKYPDNFSLRDFIESLKNDVSYKISFDYIDKFVSHLTIENFDEFLFEELYCDKIALEYTWRTCIFYFGGINPIFFGMALTLLANSLYSYSVNKEITSRQHYKNLLIRKIFIIRNSTIYFDKFTFTSFSIKKGEINKVNDSNELGRILGSHEGLIDFFNHLCIGVCLHTTPNIELAMEVVSQEYLDFDISPRNWNFLALNIIANSDAFNVIESESNPFVNQPIQYNNDNFENLHSIMEKRTSFVNEFWKHFNRK